MTKKPWILEIDLESTKRISKNRWFEFLSGDEKMTHLFLNKWNTLDLLYNPEKKC